MFLTTPMKYMIKYLDFPFISLDLLIITIQGKATLFIPSDDSARKAGWHLGQIERFLNA